jgi:hypothetical protein
MQMKADKASIMKGARLQEQYPWPLSKLTGKGQQEMYDVVMNVGVKRLMSVTVYSLRSVNVKIAGVESMLNNAIKGVRSAGVETVRSAAVQNLKIAVVESMVDAAIEGVRSAGLETVRSAAVQNVKTAGVESMVDAAETPVSPGFEGRKASTKARAVSAGVESTTTEAIVREEVMTAERTVREEVIIN